MSMGLLWLQCAGRISFSAVHRSTATSWASSPPAAISASVASTPGPPAFVTIVSRGPRGRGCFDEHFRHVEQVRDAVHAQHTAPPERGVEHFIAAGQRSRMRRRRLRRGFGASRLDHDDRLSQRHFARGRKKRSRIADRLHVDHNAVGMRIVPQIIDQVAPSHIEHGADRHESAESHLFLLRSNPESRCSSAPLWLMKRHAAGTRQCWWRKRRVQTARRDSSLPGSWVRSAASRCPAGVPESAALIPGPCSPCSLKPAEITIAPRTSASTHSEMIPGTVFAGVAITARSTASGISLTRLYARIPSTLACLSLTG